MDISVLYEDNHIIAVNKTNHDIVQGDKTGDTPLSDKVKAYIKVKYNKPGDVFLGVVHRLDRPVSGVVLFARTSKALTRLNEMFRENKVHKHYWAIVKNRPEQEQADLIHYLTRNTQKNKSTAFDKSRSDAKRSELSYVLKASTDNYHLLEVTLKTGRHHQIRCQLSKIGSPIKGDLKYNFPRSNKDGGISLHARYVEFEHPVKKELIKIVAPPPSDVLWDEFLKRVS